MVINPDKFQIIIFDKRKPDNQQIKVISFGETLTLTIRWQTEF